MEMHAPFLFKKYFDAFFVNTPGQAFLLACAFHVLNDNKANDRDFEPVLLKLKGMYGVAPVVQLKYILGVAHGVDGAASGFAELWTGEEHPSYTQRTISGGLQLTGVSAEKADKAAVAADLGIGLAIGVGSARVATTSLPRYTNLASPQRTVHIVAGDATGGGHAWFGSLKSFTNGLTGKKSMFPILWNQQKIMHAVSEVLINSPWGQQTGAAGASFTKAGAPVRYSIIGYYEGVKIRVIATATDIITAHPIK